MLGLKVSALNHRVEALDARLGTLEKGHAQRLADAGLRLEAEGLAEDLMLGPGVFAGPRGAPKPHEVNARRLLAGALRDAGWSGQKIAHVLNCSERTVERYLRKSE